MAAITRKLHVRTPLMYSEPLSAALGEGRRVYLKMDALQPPGSFKLRGIAHTIQRAIASQGGKPYRITRRGLELVRAEFDNR